MRVEEVDERRLVREQDGGVDFVVFIYQGSARGHTSWSVSSYLLTDADLPEVMRWLTENLPTEDDGPLDADTITCWSLGLVVSPMHATTGSDLEVAWIVGSDVLNTDPVHRSSHQQRLADEMLARRHRVELT